MKHIIVTGGVGFIGSFLCEELLKKGYAVTAVDNEVTGRQANVSSFGDHPNFRFIKEDVSCPEWLEKVTKADPKSSKNFIADHGLYGIFHFACPASPIDFEKIPFEILAVDSLGTMHTVDLALRFGARYLLASTSEIYGDPLVHPQKEDYFGNVNTLGPRACYDETKRFAEAYVSSAMRGSGAYKGKPYKPLNAAIVRIFNTYGPRMRIDDGRVVPEFFAKAIKNESLLVHGEGQQTRSFCFVTDLVAGCIRLFESEFNEVFNIGNPVERTVLDFAKAVIEVTGSQSKLEFAKAREDDPRQRCPDITKARNLLNWEPKVSLEEGLQKSLQYFKTQL